MYKYKNCDYISQCANENVQQEIYNNIDTIHKCRTMSSET